MIIGLTGYAGSGKSTAADVLVACGWERRKFATPLKNMLRSLLYDQGTDYDTVNRMIEGDLKEVESAMLGGKTPRYAMQTLGTEWGRMRLSDSLWVDAALRNLGDRTVFDDVRFNNEARAIRSRGGLIIRVVRPGVGRASDHMSEQLVSPDLNLINDGSLADLCERLSSADFPICAV